MALFILAVIVFVIADIIIRVVMQKAEQKKLKKEREKVLEESLQLDFSMESKTLKRAEVPNPKARILCVDDEPVILDSFRKILVLDGYSVDTVETGKEALGLIQKNNYDFVFTDLKMPEMDGVEVTKGVKNLRPDIDVVIITGYATVETAVETMKYGAMDYVQKPFTEEELLEFVKKLVIKREEKLKKQAKPKVHITNIENLTAGKMTEFAIPGGVFVSDCHCWASLTTEGEVKVGIDDFAKKVIGRIDSITFPNLGMEVKKGQPLFTVFQGTRSVTFCSPISGKVIEINEELKGNLSKLEFTPYHENWICVLDAENLDEEIRQLKIGKSAVALFEKDLNKLKELKEKLRTGKEEKYHETEFVEIGEMEKLDNNAWQRFIEEFFAS